MMIEFREAFPDVNLWGVGGLIAEGDYVFGRWDGGGTHTGPAFSDLRVGSFPAGSGRKIRFTGTTIFRIKNGKIAEEIGEEGSRWISTEKENFWGWRFTQLQSVPVRRKSSMTDHAGALENKFSRLCPSGVKRAA